MTPYECDQKHTDLLNDALRDGQLDFQEFTTGKLILGGSYTIEDLEVIMKHFKDYQDEYTRIHAEQTPAGTGGDGSRSV